MTQKHESLELSKWIAQLLDRKGGQEIAILDLRSSSSLINFFIISTGTSYRHMETLAEAPCLELKKQGFSAPSLEGENTGWLLADLGDVVIHVFDDPTRKYYDLESLWNKAPRIEWHPNSLKAIHL